MLYVVWQNIRQVEPFEKRDFKPRSIWDQHGSSPYSQPVHNGPSIVVYFLIEMPGLLFANFKPVCLPLAFWTMQPSHSIPNPLDQKCNKRFHFHSLDCVFLSFLPPTFTPSTLPLDLNGYGTRARAFCFRPQRAFYSCGRKERGK